MSSAEWYCVVKEHGVYNIHVVESNLNKIYKKLCLAISTEDLDQVVDSEYLTYTLVNQPIFICDINCCYTNCIAVNLCHYAVFNNCREILKKLLKHGGDLSRKTVEVTLSQGQRNFEDKDSLIDLIVRHFDDPVKYFQGLFDEYIETTDLGRTYEFKLDFTILYPSANMDKKDLEGERQMCVLNEIVNSAYDVHSEECDLLQHPLIEAYLTCKWIHYRRFFYILVAIHVLFVACLSVTAYLIVDNFENFSGTPNTTAEFDYQSNMPKVVLNVMTTLYCLIFFLGVVLFGHALIQAFFIPLRKLYCQFEILSNLVTSVSVLLISGFGFFFPFHWHLFHTLPIIILTAWINLMLIIGRIPWLGCYSLMFTTVMKNFLKVMVSFICLISGFALSFSLILPMSELFNNPFRAFLRTVVMMVGELDYADTFSKEGPFLSKFIFVLFVISCSIILMNLTQGIAVNDIKLLHEISQTIRLEKETRFLYEFECIFTQRVITSNSFCRKIKKRLYDSGAIQSEMRITKESRQRISQALFSMLVLVPLVFLFFNKFYLFS